MNLPLESEFSPDGNWAGQINIVLNFAGGGELQLLERPSSGAEHVSGHPWREKFRRVSRIGLRHSIHRL